MFSMDRECISALVTFEHLNLMCRNKNVPSPTQVPERYVIIFDRTRLELI